MPGEAGVSPSDLQDVPARSRRASTEGSSQEMRTVLGAMPNRRWSRWKGCCSVATRKSLTLTSRTTFRCVEQLRPGVEKFHEGAAVSQGEVDGDPWRERTVRADIGFGVENHNDGRTIVEMGIEVPPFIAPLSCRCVDRPRTPLFQRGRCQVFCSRWDDPPADGGRSCCDACV